MSNLSFNKDLQYYKFCAYGFLKNLRFFEPFLILFFMDRGLTFFQIGALYSIREVVRNIFEIPAGVFADILGRRRTMVISFIVYLLSFVIFFLSNRYIIFISAMCLYAFADAFRTGTHKAMIFEYLKIKGWGDLKVGYYGHTRSWSQIGSAISSLLAGGLVFISGSYEYAFLFSIVPYLIGLLLMISYPKELDGDIDSRRKRGQKQIFKEVISEFITTFNNIKVLKSLANVSSFSGYFKAVKDWLQPVIQTLALSIPVFLYLDDEKRTAILIGIVYFVIYLLSSLAARNSGNVLRRFKSIGMALNATLIIGLVAGIFSGVFYLIGISSIAILLFLVMFMLENSRKPIGVSFIAGFIKKDILATTLSVESQVKSIFTAIIALALGYLADKFGLGIALMLVTGVLVLLVPFIMLRTKSQEPRTKIERSETPTKEGP